MNQPAPVITARRLARTFQTRTGRVEAVRGIDVDVQTGEIIGLLGPNGAGKTTTVRMLTTLLAPTAGDATIAGHDLRHDPRGVRSRIGYVAQGGSTSDESLVLEEIILQARLFGIGKARAKANATALLPSLDLDGLEHRPCRQLSGGQRRRVDIALGLVHQPHIIFLDEPTSGLDPQSRANLWEHIRKLRTDGVTVVLSTHYLDEADALCDRLLVMDHGTIVADGTPDELKRRISGDIVTVEIDTTAMAGSGDTASSRSDRAASSPESARSTPGTDATVRAARQAVDVRSVLVERNRVHVTVEHGDQAVVPILRALDGAGIAPSALTVKRPSLDDVFLSLTGRSLRDSDENRDRGRAGGMTSEPETGTPAVSHP
ncbi:ATP-binding cassette domain-containing protein [Actinobacteria bacterium YIM 96077]|uniref:ABC transporter n=1 Tax=Phytoactinopolyspora halophila TaxID=1981511 RepID=A0A329R2Q8_9ACTN|nr:ATP-binding cassette domain-containing protein [Phytoactinopolyspora halophila]AYY12122.1 ATP-binding cassette domain-containing protein [Actinobacteria bacterium YIM 96077]RAW18643.1 ABC transporter [Phytoactinopolyspora halophila]